MKSTLLERILLMFLSAWFCVGAGFWFTAALRAPEDTRTMWFITAGLWLAATTTAFITRIVNAESSHGGLGGNDNHETRSPAVGCDDLL